MDRRDFHSMMKFLKSQKLVFSQRELAQRLGLTEATVSEMKTRGYVTEKWMRNVLNVVAAENGMDEGDLIAMALEKIPEYDEEKGRRLKEEAGVKGRDFLLPSREKCEELLRLENAEFDYYSDVFAINKKLLKKKSLSQKDVAIIQYHKPNMSPKIGSGDVLLIKKCVEFEGPGYYIFEEYNDIKIYHISQILNDLSSLKMKTTIEKEEIVRKGDLSKHKMIAKVIFLFRDLVLFDV